MIPRSLYIHIPWCIRKCPYCDFNSHKSPEVLPEEEYVNALIRDLKHDLSEFPGTHLDTIFIGGGTPSLFAARYYEQLLNQIQQLIPFVEHIEITLEANPGTVEQQRFNDYRSLGINRLSLGIQSFNPSHLKQLGRIHDDNQAHQAIDCARRAGFDNINIDIMHGLPNQSVAEGIADLHTAIQYNPEHLSWYQLTIEANTIFYKQQPVLPNEDDLSLLENEGFALLQANNYRRYEISAFSRGDKQAKHNTNYWLFGDYYGIGAGAHGKLTAATDHAVYRTEKQRQPTLYLAKEKPFRSKVIRVNPHDLVFEFMLNTSRLQAAVAYELFTQRTGLELSYLLPGLHLAESKGLINMNQSHWQITPFGRQYTNDLQALFLAK